MKKVSEFNLFRAFRSIPLRSLLVGAISERIGAPATVLGQGIVGFVVAVVFARALWGRAGDKPSNS